MDPQDVPFRCSSCSFRAQTYTETYKHVQEVHPQGEVHANPNPYVATFQHTHPEEWDLKVVEAEVNYSSKSPLKIIKFTRYTFYVFGYTEKRKECLLDKI